MAHQGAWLQHHSEPLAHQRARRGLEAVEADAADRHARAEQPVPLRRRHVAVEVQVQRHVCAENNTGSKSSVYRDIVTIACCEHIVYTT